MPIFKPNQKTYAMDPMDVPLASVAQGEAFTLFTENALDAEEGYFNPLTGPISVEGAKAGDTLAVDILEIRPHDGTAISRIHNGVGALSPTEDTPLLGAPPMERVYHYVQQGQDFVCRENQRLRFAYRPFLGTLGTAPRYERISSVVPGPHGGNLDVKDVCPGRTVYLPVYTDGAKLYAGDAHACQGDGEFCGTALEMAAEVTLRCRVLPKKRIEGPRIGNPNASDDGGRRQALGKRGPHGVPRAHRLDGSRFRLGCFGCISGNYPGWADVSGAAGKPPVYHGGRVAKIADIGRKRKIEYMENAQRPLRGPFFDCCSGAFFAAAARQMGKKQKI